MSCTVVDHSKPEHDFTFIAQVAPQEKEIICKLLSEARQRAEGVDAAIVVIQQTKQQMLDRKVSAEAEIKRAFERMYDELRDREKQTRNMVAAQCLSSEKILTSQAEALTTFRSCLASSIDFVARTLDQGSDAQVLLSKPVLLRRLGELQQQETVLMPAATADLFVNTDPSSMRASLESFCESAVPNAPPERPGGTYGHPTRCISKAIDLDERQDSRDPQGRDRILAATGQDSYFVVVASQFAILRVSFAEAESVLAMEDGGAARRSSVSPVGAHLTDIRA
jgi:hypothetical protein